MNVDQLYRQVVQSHSISGRNKHHLAEPTVVQAGVNPSCGDEIALELKTGKDGLIEDVSFTGSGCAISQASVSIMADLVRGHTFAEARELEGLFMHMIRDGELAEEEALRLQEASIFSTVSHMPARVKCAVLGWRTLMQAIEKVEENGRKDGTR